MVKKIMNKFMIKGSKTLMQWMLDWRVYGLKIYYSMTAQSYVDWMKNWVCYKDKEFSMDWLRGMMHGLVGKCRKMLVKKVMKVNKMEEKKKKKLLAVLWVKLKDDSNCEKMGHNFVWNEYNL